MPKLIPCILTILIPASSILVAAPGESLQDKLLNMPSEHPRLFLKKDQWAAQKQKVNANPLLKAFEHRILKTADAMLSLPTLERELEGKRMLGVSRKAVKRITYLAYAYYTTGNQQYAERAVDEMIAISHFSDWNPSHFLDVGEMTAALGIGYDWLYDTMEEEQRAFIRQAIISKGLQTSIEHDHWVSMTNNWNPVCNGGLAIGALAIYEHAPKLALNILQRAIDQIPNAMSAYAPDGAYEEGPGYWKYGTLYTLLYIDAMVSALGTDFGLSASEGFMKSSDYIANVTAPGGDFFNYADNSAASSVAPSMFWFARERNNTSILWSQLQKLKATNATPINPESHHERQFVFLLIWAPPIDHVDPPDNLHYVSRGRIPIAIHRNGWETEDLFLGVKAGKAYAPHGHQDVGSFIMESQGVRWAIDMGPQNYNSIEELGMNLWERAQTSDRWRVFRLNSLSHNTLVVNGKQQNVQGFAYIYKHSSDAEIPHTIIDMASTYHDQLQSAMRGFAILDSNKVLIQDELTTHDQDTQVRWGMLTEANLKIEGSSAQLMQDGKSMHLYILEPENATWQEFDTENPPNSWDVENPGTRMVGFYADLEPGNNHTLRVLLSPDEIQQDTYPSRSLRNWR